MLQPAGFCQSSISTSLGTLVYYTAKAASAKVTNGEATPLPSPGPDLSDHRPTLVFLHGFGGGSSAYEWSHVYPAFVPEYRVLAPDLIGWGRSQHLARSYQIQDYVTTIVEFIEKVCGTATMVVASSLTAALMVRIAVARPELVKAMFLVAPAGLADFGRPYRNFFSQLVSLPVLDRLIYDTMIATRLGIRNFLETKQFARANRVSQEMVDAYLASAQQPGADYSAISFVRGDLCFDLAAYIPQLTVPTAVLWGKQAQFTSAELGQQLVDLNPRAIQIFTLLDDVGLTPQLELPAVTTGLIYDALARLTQC
ncbi:MAG: alpha/beta hydrolase [Elainella sp. C42_A2020_010]|nr:alpha/beta hydrolase [Elainella sp. C42_A2020_010]RNJ65788.1 MAG: alpha/beta hydrolase [Leptolyngbya sp. IPPAS B-1204]